MATKEKVMVSLDDGEKTIATTKEGWTKESVTGLPALLSGWQEGKGSHHGITLGMALACKDKVEGAYLGDFNGVPVFDPKAINNAMSDAFCEKHDIEPIQFKVAGNRTGAKKQLTELAGLANDETMARLQEINPELAEKLSKLM